MQTTIILMRLGALALLGVFSFLFYDAVRNYAFARTIGQQRTWTDQVCVTGILSLIFAVLTFVAWFAL